MVDVLLVLSNSIFKPLVFRWGVGGRVLLDLSDDLAGVEDGVVVVKSTTRFRRVLLVFYRLKSRGKLAINRHLVKSI